MATNGIDPKLVENENGFDLELLLDQATDLDTMDSLINHTDWYDRQCISHYDDALHPPYLGLMLNYSTSAPPAAVSPSAAAVSSVRQLAFHPPGGAAATTATDYSTLANLRCCPLQPMAFSAVNASDGDYVPSPGRMTMDHGRTPRGSTHVNDRYRAAIDLPRASPAHSISSNESDDIQDALEVMSHRLKHEDASLADLLFSFLRTRRGIELVARANDVSSTDLAAFLDRSQLHSPSHKDIRSPESHSDTASPRCNDSSPARTRKSRGSYSRSKCLEVVKFVRQGGHSARAAAKKFGIPKSTVHNWLHEDIASRPERGHRKRAKADCSPCPSPRMMTDGNNANDRNDDCAFPSVVENASHVTMPQMSLRPYPVKQETMGDINMDANFEDLKEDWVEQENWYAEQYLQHYSSSPLEPYTPEVSLSSMDGLPQQQQPFGPTNVARSGGYALLPGHDAGILPVQIENQLVQEVQRLTISEPRPTREDIYNRISERAAGFFTPTEKWCDTFLARYGIFLPPTSNPRAGV